MSQAHPPIVDDRVPIAQAHGAGHGYTPYIPPTQSPAELTIRALVLGSVLGILFAASSVYLAVKVGITVSASIPIAVLSIAIFRAVGRRSTILENTIVQTTGSAGESLAFGVAAALPALLLMGYDIKLGHAFFVAALGGVLGVLMMIPLRHGLIVQEHGKLMYPEGTACADVLIVGEQGGTNARTVVMGFIVGSLYKVAYNTLKLWREVIGTSLSWVDKATGQVKGYIGGSIHSEVSPELLGVGYIIGPRVAGVTFAGGVLSYLLLIPMIKFFGQGLDEPFVSHTGTLIRDMSPDSVRDHYVLYIGAGAVATGGLISLIRSFPTIVSAFQRGLKTFLDSRKGGSDVGMIRTQQDLPITVVIAGSAVLLLAIWLLPALEVNFLSALLILVCGFFFVTVSARITGEIGSSSNPISGMVVATLLIICLVYLLLGWTSAEDRFMALSTAAIVGIAASNGGTTAQDLKTAFLVGGTPRRQQLALFVGVLTSAAFIGLTLIILNQETVIPEPHPGVKLTHPTDEQVTQKVFAFAPDLAKLEARGLSQEQLRNAFWLESYEYRPEAGGATLRSFASPTLEDVRGLQLSVTTAEGKALRIPVTDLGTIAAAPDVSYQVGFVRGAAEVPAGKYLVDGSDTVQYVVDPAIGGRVTEYAGQRLERYDAPKARLFALIIDGILTQQLPWALVLFGVFIAILLELCGVSSLPFAVGVYLPLSTSAPIFVGGVARYIVERFRRSKTEAEAEFSPGVLLAAGLIAGGAIAGVLHALLAVPANGDWLRTINVPNRTHGTGFFGDVVNAISGSEAAHPIWSNLWALLFFGALAAFLLRTGLKGQSGAVTPPPASDNQGRPSP